MISTLQEVALDMACTLHWSLHVPLQQGRLVLKTTEWRHGIILPKPSAMFLPVCTHSSTLLLSLHQRTAAMLTSKMEVSVTLFSYKHNFFPEKMDRISPDVRRVGSLSLWLLLFLAASASSLVRVSTSVSRQQCCLSQQTNPDWMTDCAKKTHAHAHAHTQQLGEALYKLGSGTALKGYANFFRDILPLRWNVKFGWWYAQE